MGYGGALIWTSFFKNVKNEHPNKKIIFIYPLSWKAFLCGKKHPDICIYKNNKTVNKLIPSCLWHIFKYTVSNKKCYIVDSTKKVPFIINDTPEKITYKAGKHMVDYIADDENIPVTEYAPEIILDDTEIYNAKTILEKNELADKKFICFEPNSKISFTPNKSWDWAYWEKTITAIQKHINTHNLNIQCVQIGAPNSKVLPNCINLCNSGLTFRETAYVLKKANFFVSYMGGLLHLNKAIGGKNIAIISAFEPKELGTYTDDINFYTDIDCKNCGLKTPCPINRKCTKSIKPQNVINAIIQELS